MLGVVGCQGLEVSEFVSPYSGEGKVQRLLYIANANPVLARDCWLLLERIVLEQAANTGFANAELYKTCMEHLEKPLDTSWLAQVQTKASIKLERLQNDLKIVFDTSQRNDIRNIQSEIGDIYYAQGYFAEALKSYYKCRSYNSSQQQSLEMFMKIITIHCATGFASKAQTHVSKAENSVTADDIVTQANLKVASALVSLTNGNYKTAAFKFLDVPNTFSANNFTEVMIPHDVALYGVFCALASFSRSEIKSNVLENRSFREFLELQPELRDLVKSFYLCKYSSFLDLYKRWEPRIHLEFLMSPHSVDISKKIRERVLVQYVTPYSSLCLSTMANVFSCSIKDLEGDLCELILNSTIKAHIDSHNQVLHTSTEQVRNNTFRDTMQMGEKHQQQMSAFILRNNLLKWNFSVKQPEKSRK